MSVEGTGGISRLVQLPEWTRDLMYNRPWAMLIGRGVLSTACKALFGFIRKQKSRWMDEIRIGHCWSGGCIFSFQGYPSQRNKSHVFIVFGVSYFFFPSTKSPRLDTIAATCRSRYGSSGQTSILNFHTRWIIAMQTEVRDCDAMVRVSGAGTTNRSTARINCRMVKDECSDG